MNKRDVIIVVPVYKEDLTIFEDISLSRLLSVMNRYNITFCAPNTLCVNNLSHDCVTGIERFDDSFFSSISGYNRLMLSKEFYSRFEKYKYLLIYQLDAFVFSDRLIEFCNMEYDYIGAPWRYPFGRYEVSNKILIGTVGNGGFSLRRVEAFIEICEKYTNEMLEWESAEDTFWDYCSKHLYTSFRVAPVDVAKRFSIEDLPEKWYKENGFELPFGCHAWMKKSRDFYLKIFKELGIDLTYYAHDMGDSDVEHELFYANSVGYSFLEKGNYRPIGLPQISNKEVIVWGDIDYVKDYVDFLLENEYCVKTIYVKWNPTDMKLYRNIPVVLDSPPAQFEIMMVVGTVWKEDEDVEKLQQLGYEYGKDFISFKREIIKIWRKIIWP